jgi:hypothetical protein
MAGAEGARDSEGAEDEEDMFCGFWMRMKDLEPWTLKLVGGCLLLIELVKNLLSVVYIG